jgi:glycerate-2-kinase
LEAVFRAALSAVAPGACVRRHVQRQGDTLRMGSVSWEIGGGSRVAVLAAGKAALGMADAMVGVLGDRLGGGLVVSNVPGSVPGLDVVVGTHPVPSEDSVRAGAAMVSRLQALRDKDRFVFLLSGGASALCELPLPPLSLADLGATTRLLLSAGAPIDELNAVRKHLSQVKGGRLGSLTTAPGVVLVLSDVVGDDLSAMGSGPFHHDDTTFAGCLRILEQRGILPRVPGSVARVLQAGARGQFPETPRVPWPHVTHVVVGSNTAALEAAAREASRLGFSPVVHPEPVQGEAREVGPALLERVLRHPPGARPDSLFWRG